MAAKPLLNEFTVDEVFEIEVTEEMADHLQSYLDITAAYPGEHDYEKRIPMSFLSVPDQFGTSDFCAAWSDPGIKGGVLMVDDLKYGKGVKVYAEWNEQLLSYAAGRFLELDFLYDFQRIVLTIHQPRRDHLDIWECSREELLAFMEKANQQTLLSLQPDAPVLPGEKQCTFCPADGKCPAQKEYTEKLVSGAFDDLEDFHFDIADVDLLTIHEMEKIWIASAPAFKFLNGLKKQLYAHAANGGPLRLLKLVAGNGKSQWESEEEARFFMDMYGIPGDEQEIRKLKSPNQIKKLLPKKGKKEMGDLAKEGKLIKKSKGKPTLVPMTDKRQALVVSSADDIFDNLDEEEDDDDL